MKPVTSLNKKALLALWLIPLAIGAFLIAIGIWIHGLVLDGAEQNYRKYQTAIQIINDREFNYSIDTKQGNILAPVVVNKVDEVKFEEMNKSFPRVVKTEERYNEHEREVCSSDSEGNETCYTETYYEWDFNDRWTKSAGQVEVAGRKYPFSLFNTHSRSIKAQEIINGAEGRYMYIRSPGGLFGRSWFSSDSEGDLRYSYDVTELPQSGTIFANTTNGLMPINGSSFTLESKSGQEQVEAAGNNVTMQHWAFTIGWTILVLGCMGGAIYLVIQRFSL